MKSWSIAAIVVILPLAGCMSNDGFSSQRTVFNNPFVPPVIDDRGIGPDCDPRVIRAPVCTYDAAIYRGRGKHASLGNGYSIRLTRAERRFLRERAEAIEAQLDVFESLENGTPLPPGSPALPNGGADLTPSPSLPPQPSNDYDRVEP